MHSLRKSLLPAFAGSAIALGGSPMAGAISLDFVNVTGTSLATSASLQFDGAGNFSFPAATTGPNAGWDFIINGITDGVGDSFGLKGLIIGTFSIGANAAGTPETATVTSSAGATLSIFDGTTTFSGLIDWIELARDGTSGDLNVHGAVNLTGITYTGTVQDLIDLKGASDIASATIAFSFNPAKSIADLKSTRAKTSYSGDLTSVPDNGTPLLLMGMGLAGVLGTRRKQRRA